jgi:hypothetical protein
LQKIDQLAFGHQQIGAVQGQQRLALFHRLAGGGNLQFFHVAFHAADVAPAAQRVVSHHARGADGGLKRARFHRRVGHADKLLPARRNVELNLAAEIPTRMAGRRRWFEF